MSRNSSAFFSSEVASTSSAGCRSFTSAFATATWTEVGNTSFDDCEALTWSFGCTWTSVPVELAVRERREDLVGVHVGRGARTGLEDIDREVGVVGRRRSPCPPRCGSPRRAGRRGRPVPRSRRRRPSSPGLVRRCARSRASCRRSGSSPPHAVSVRCTGRQRGPSLRPSCRARCGIPASFFPSLLEVRGCGIWWVRAARLRPRGRRCAGGSGQVRVRRSTGMPLASTIGPRCDDGVHATVVQPVGEARRSPDGLRAGPA